jgi:hypothetical protein
MKLNGKVVDFIFGFLAFLFVNAVLYAIATAPSPPAAEAGPTQEDVTEFIKCGVFPMIVNILLFYLLANWERAMLQGALFALGSLTVLPIIAGICLVVGCIMLGLIQ